MGAGKSSLGWKLSLFLKLQHYDSDKIISFSSGVPAGVLFSRNPREFRKRELELIQNTSSKGLIFSLGGGAVECPVTCALLKGRPVLWLDPGVDACWERVQKDTTYRPLAVNYEDFIALYHKRVPLYRECARWHLQSLSPPEQLVNEVIELTGIRA
jgi:shikimate kinase